MKNQLAKEVIEYKILLDDLQEKTKQVKALLIQTEDYLIDFDLQAPYERIRIRARESGVAGNPGTLQITMVVW